MKYVLAHYRVDLLGWIVYPGANGSSWGYSSLTHGPAYYPTHDDANAAREFMRFTFPSQAEDFTVFPEDILPS